MTHAKTATALLDIETALLADETGAVRRQYVARLESLAQSIQQRLRTMCDRTTFSEASAALAAVNGAVDVLRSTKGGKSGGGRDMDRSPFSIASFIK
jgi:hypothetical protein